MNYRLPALGLALLLSCSSAQAGRLYGDINYEFQYFDISDSKFTPQMVTGTLGVWLYKGIGLEGNFGAGTTDDTENGLTLETDTMTAVNIRFESPNQVGATAYILLGAVNYDLKGSQTNSNFPGKESFDGYHVGAGLNQYFPNASNTAINFSGHVYGLDEDIDSYGLRIGIRHDF